MPTVALVEFKDEVKLIDVTNDMVRLKNHVKNLREKVGGGGLCPEASGQALSLALDHIKEGGTIIFSTDASPYPDTDVDAIIERIGDQKVQFMSLGSGDCKGDTQQVDNNWNDKIGQ